MSQTAVSLASRLGEFVGTGRILADPASLARYEVDGRRPSASLLPLSEIEIAEILRFASAERLAVIAVAGKTHLHTGMPPRRYDLALDLSGMSRLLAYEPRDLTMGAEPGITFANLSENLREKGQFLPLAPPFGERATLGGIVAAAVDTPFRYGHGAAKDFLLGVEFVTGDGVISKSGGRVVKNVTGYELHKLFVGSLGTLGVITRLNFRTFPLPPAQKMFVAAFANLAGALALCRGIMKSPLQPRILDVIDPTAAGLFVARGDRFLDARHWHVIIEAAGQDTVLQRHARDLASMSRDAHASEFLAIDEGQRHELFASLRDFSPIAFGASAAATIFRVPVLPTAIERLIEQMRKVAERHSLPCSVLIRALGVLYFVLLPEGDVAVAPELLNCSRELTDLCITSGAAAVIERCPLEMKNALNIWPPTESDQEIARRLKLVFDPQGVLSPGRFRGGI